MINKHLKNKLMVNCNIFVTKISHFLKNLKYFLCKHKTENNVNMYFTTLDVVFPYINTPNNKTFYKFQ